MSLTFTQLATLKPAIPTYQGGRKAVFRRLTAAVALIFLASSSFAQNLPMFAAPGTVEATMRVSGATYQVISGDAFRVRSPTSRVFVGNLYDPSYYFKNYDVDNGVIYRADRAAGVRYPVLASMAEGFEDAVGIRALIGPARGWTSITLLEPSAPTVSAMIVLRNAVLAGTSDFRDNRVEPSTARAKSGLSSLRVNAVPPSPGMLVSKASIETSLLHFVRGEHVWVRAWVFIESGTPLGLLDLESSFIIENPGLRVLLNDQLQPRVELKWGAKPTWRATVSLPRGQWFRLTLHVALSEQTNGRVEMWIDDRQVIGANGQTLPLPSTVYDRLQVGITANPAGSNSVVFFDDLSVSK